MPAVGETGRRVKFKPPAKKKKAKAPPKRKPVLRAPSPDQQDRSRAAQRPPTPDQADRNRPPEQKARDKKVVARNVKKARIKAIRRTRPSGTELIKRELEGKGVVAKALSGVAERHSKRAPTSTSAVKASALDEGAPGLVKRATKDFINLPAQAIPSLYVPTAGVVEAAKGKPERLKKFAEEFKQTDPIYNLGAAGVEKVRGNEKAAKSHLAKAKKSASEHPGFTVAEAVGVRGSAGRAGGAAARTGVAGKKAKQAASTEREPKRLEGTKLREERRYSKDPAQKAVQVRKERSARERAAEERERARATDDPDVRVEHERRARAADPDKMRDRDIAKRVDEHVDAVEQVRRKHRAETVARVRKQTRKVRKAGPVPNLLAQRIVRADVDDLKAYVRELEAEHKNLSPSRRRANEQLRHRLGKAVKRAERGKLDLAKVKERVDEYARTSREGQQGLVRRGMLDAEQAERASLIPYAVRRMGAKHDGSRLVSRTGKELSTAAIRAHMRRAGEDPPAFLSQAPNARGGRNFYVNAARAPKATGAARTGEATRKGTFGAHPDTLTEQAARTQGLTDAFDHFQRFVDEFGYRDPRGRGGIRTKRTKRDADNLARDLSAGETEWTAVRVNPFGASKEQLERMLEGTEPDTPVHTALERALAGEDGDGPWAIVPKAAADRMQEHLRVLNPGNAGRAARAVNSAFRKTVLATSLPWLVGNVTEAALRTALAKAGPRSYLTGRRVMKRAEQIDPKQAEFSQARMIGGGHFGFAERQHIHTDLNQFRDGVVKDMARPMAAALRSPGPKHLAEVWNVWTHAVFQVVNKTVEQQFQTAMAGKLAREQLMTGHALKLSKKATDQAARGILDDNTAVALGREIDRMYGKYGKFSPDHRKMIALYTPFVAWTLNALTFVASVLPRDHPAALAAIASASIVTDEWRKEHGLDKFIDGAVPGWLQGSIPAASGEKFRAPNRYTPFGLFADPLGGAASSVLPQYSGVLNAFKGQDWKGNKLRGKNGQELNDLEKGAAAAKSFAEATVPLLGLGGRIKKKGFKGAVLESAVGKVEPQKPTSSPPRLRVPKSSFSGSSYGSGSFGGSSFSGSSFK